MSWNNLACVSDFDDGHAEAIAKQDRRHEEIMSRLKVIDSATLQDALDAAGSFDVTFALVAELVRSEPKEELTVCAKIFSSVYDDMWALLKKEANQ